MLLQCINVQAKQCRIKGHPCPSPIGHPKISDTPCCVRTAVLACANKDCMMSRNLPNQSLIWLLWPYLLGHPTAESASIAGKKMLCFGYDIGIKDHGWRLSALSYTSWNWLEYDQQLSAYMSDVVWYMAACFQPHLEGLMLAEGG